MSEADISKNNRVLDIYIKLKAGGLVNKTEAADYYGVNERSIQRDIDDIRGYLDDRSTREDGSRNVKIQYDRAEKGYRMTGGINNHLTNSQVLAVAKILLESRALEKEEIMPILDTIIAGCIPHKNYEIVNELIANEKHHYVEPKHKTPLTERMWELGAAIRENRITELKYKKAGGEKPVKRMVEPVSIMFSEYYFYLVAYMVEKDRKNGRYQQLFQYPTIYRLDRIDSFKVKKEHFKIPYAERFEEGEFRKRVQFMYGGELNRITFRYTGSNLEAILDRMPTAEVILRDGPSYIIQAETFGDGVIMWLLSQGEAIQVMAPESYCEKIKQKLEKMLKLYE